MSKNLATENQKEMFFATKKGENLLTRLKQSINDSVDNPEIAQGVLNNLDNLLSFIKEKADEKIQRIKEDEVVIKALHKQLTTVEHQYSYLNTLRKKAFGSMSEAEFSKKILESISKEAKKEQENTAKQEDLFNPIIFNEIEGVLEHNEAVDIVTTANENKEETKAKTKKRAGKAKGVKNNLSIEVLEELGVEVREDVLPHETHCPVCHEELKEMGSVVESTTLEYVPAKVILVKKIRKTIDRKS